MSWGVIAQMGRVSIQTPDVDGAVAEAQTLLGLSETRRDGNGVNLAASDAGSELTYIEGSTNAIQSIGLRASDAESLAELRRRLRDNNATILDSPVSADAEGLSFVGPEGWRFDVYLEPEQHPLGRGGLGPQRFGHINLHPTDVKRMASFLIDVLDFRVSDQIGDIAYFLRCNSEHHGIAILQGSGRLHHHAWQFRSTEDLVNMCDRLHEAGRDVIWGPVRHGAGQNIAAYYVESTGAVVELYTDMEQIYDDNRPAVIWGADDNWYNLWSDARPLDFRSFGLPTAGGRG